MLRAPLFCGVHARVGRSGPSPLRVGLLALGITLIVGSVSARSQDQSGALYDIPLPGGLPRALAVIGDRVPADRGQFLLEFIRRTYSGLVRRDRRDQALQALLSHLERSQGETVALPLSETLPLPLPPALWTETVFGGRTKPQSLVSAILQSRDASLLYCALLSLDDGTRSWFAGQPALVREVATRHAAAFLVAAPGLRVSAGVVNVPGGEIAQPVWEALVGRSVKEAADFVRALLSERDKRLPYFFGAVGQLTPVQIRALLNLDAPDVPSRVAAARSLQKVFERIAVAWNIDDQPFWRPLYDPALLVADLAIDAEGKPFVPGTRRFWSGVFAEIDRARPEEVTGVGGERGSDRATVDLPWLCEQVFKAVPNWRRRYHVVLFAGRTLKRIDPSRERDAIEALRAVAVYPALAMSLERAGVTDVTQFAAASRRAAQLATIDDRTRAGRALAQFQGALALLTRAASRGNLPLSALSAHVSSLAALQPNERGDYDGRLLRWLDSSLLEPSAKTIASGASAGTSGDDDETVEGDADKSLVQTLAGAVASAPQFVEWEGTRYRVDLAASETIRLAKLLGDDAPPYVSAARSVLRIADAVEATGLAARSLREHNDALTRVTDAVGCHDPVRWKGTDVCGRCRAVSSALERAARNSDISGARRVAPELRVLADDLLARGLLQLTYATALGQPERVSVTADAAARRHDFGLTSPADARTAAWQLPSKKDDTPRGWVVAGSLLGLDVKLAEFSLIRLSTKPPLQRPTLNDEDRRVLTEAVALVQSGSLTDADRDAITAALQQGRARLAAVRTSGEAAALADEIRLSPARRSLLPWIVARDPERVPAFLSPAELLSLGREGVPLPAQFQAWGAPAESRLGCLCLQLIERRPWETLAGRHSGTLASGFPDLNIRLAELLAELQMPASLLGPVLASATLDFINGVTSRDQDDWRALVEFVQALRRDKVEQYLALLTTDGPLVPSDATDRKGAAVEDRR